MYTVLGAKGFIGSRVVKSLQKSGVEAYTPARDDDGVFKKPLGKVLYCIGLTNDYKDRPFDSVEAHASLLSRILQLSQFDRLVYLSSTRLYDGLDTTSEIADLKLNPVNPRHIYDFSKGLGENLCLTASNNRACVARLASVYDDGPNATGFVPDMLRRLKKEKHFTLDSSSGIVRDYVHIDDVVSALSKLVDGTDTGITNVGSGENLSNQDIVDTLNDSGCFIKLQRQSQRETPPLTDVKKLNSIGVKPLLLRSYLKTYMGGL